MLSSIILYFYWGYLSPNNMPWVIWGLLPHTSINRSCIGEQGSWEMSPSGSKIYMCMKHKSIHLFHTYKYMYFKYMDYMHETESGRSCTPWTDTVRDFIDNGHMWSQCCGFNLYLILLFCHITYCTSKCPYACQCTHWICILLICRLWFENGRLLPLCLE